MYILSVGACRHAICYLLIWMISGSVRSLMLFTDFGICSEFGLKQAPIPFLTPIGHCVTSFEGKGNSSPLGLVGLSISIFTIYHVLGGKLVPRKRMMLGLRGTNITCILGFLPKIRKNTSYFKYMSLLPQGRLHTSS